MIDSQADIDVSSSKNVKQMGAKSALAAKTTQMQAFRCALIQKGIDAQRKYVVFAKN